MTGIQDDLATLRWSVERLMYAEGIKAVGRVEDEIARLNEALIHDDVGVLAARLQATEQALATVRAEIMLPDHIAEIVGRALEGAAE